jgi:hypothetical protein
LASGPGVACRDIPVVLSVGVRPRSREYFWINRLIGVVLRERAVCMPSNVPRSVCSREYELRNLGRLGARRPHAGFATRSRGAQRIHGNRFKLAARVTAESVPTIINGVAVHNKCKAVRRWTSDSSRHHCLSRIAIDRSVGVSVAIERSEVRGDDRRVGNTACFPNTGFAMRLLRTHCKRYASAAVIFGAVIAISAWLTLPRTNFAPIAASVHVATSSGEGGVART